MNDLAGWKEMGISLSSIIRSDLWGERFANEEFAGDQCYFVKLRDQLYLGTIFRSNMSRIYNERKRPHLDPAREESLLAILPKLSIRVIRVPTHADTC